MIAAELAERLGTDLGVDVGRRASPTRSPPTSPAYARRSPPPRCAAAPRRRASARRSPAVRRRHRSTPIDADRNSYDYRLVVSRKLYDDAVGTAHVAVAGPARAGLARSTCTRSTSTALGVARRRRRQGHQRARHRSCSPVVADDGVAARHGVGAVQPARRRASASSSIRTAPVTDVRIETL